MARILHFSSGPDSWKAFLAKPTHWKTGRSARTLAHCWESADGFPREVSSAFSSSRDPLLQNLIPLIAVPEFKVPLPGGNRASQNDVFVLAKSDAGPVVIMVEGKVDEPFGETLKAWLAGASRGKSTRLAYLQQQLGLRSRPKPSTRYQLLHRAVSAISTGEQFRAVAAVMLVHSFNEQDAGYQDYRAFAEQLGAAGSMGVVERVKSKSAIPLFVGWMRGDCTFLTK